MSLSEVDVLHPIEGRRDSLDLERHLQNEHGLEVVEVRFEGRELRGVRYV